jgi:hypothetical protein
MDFDTLINDGWGKHADDTEAVIAMLEEHRGLVNSGERAAKYARLAAHAVGEHGGDWPRAEALISEALEPLPRVRILAMRWSN